MSQHLQSHEFVDAIDSRLAVERRQHLESCRTCQDELRDLQQILSDVGTSSAAEPSPLFWEHLSARVRSATAGLEPRRTPWWRGGWQPVAAMACVVVAVLLAETLHRTRFAAVNVSDGVSEVANTSPISNAAVVASDDESLNFVASVAAAVSAEELQQAAWPSADATDAMVDQLTQEQRAELVRLLTSRMKGGE
jgi:hypothetical protein